MATATFIVLDHYNKRSTHQFLIPDVTAANFDATITLLDTYQTGLAAVTVGNIVGRSISVDQPTPANIPPADPFAKRETKLAFSWTDTVNGEKGTIRIPAGDYDVTTVANQTAIDLSDTEVAQWVSAYEAVARSKFGNTVTVVSGKVVSTSG